ncbi:MAG: hypothetical protein WCJ56_13640 [bacterium]
MTEHGYTYDLVVLVADKNMEQSVSGLLARTSSIGISEIKAEIITNPQKDSGCRVRPESFLRYYQNSAQYALVLFDYEGCGDSVNCAEMLETQVENILTKNGWPNRCGAVVINPELEQWVWTTSEEIPGILGQQRSYSEMLTHLQDSGFTFNADGKPNRPKEAVELLLKQARIPRSSSIYGKLAAKVSLKYCTDRAFTKFTSLLQYWFPIA